MAYNKFTQAQIRGLVAAGVATDCTRDTHRRGNFNVIGASSGAYGCNGLLMVGSNGKLYAITDRAQSLFLYM